MSNKQKQNFVDGTVEYRAEFRYTPCNIYIKIFNGKQQKKTYQELLRRVQASLQQIRICPRQCNSNSTKFVGYLTIVRSGKPFADGEYANNSCLIWPMRTFWTKIK